MTEKMIVLADLGRVKAFRVSYDMLTSKPQIELVRDCEFLEAHGRLVNKVSDLAGHFSQNGMAGGSNGENHNLRGEMERRLLRQVAEMISDVVKDQRHWFLAAGEGINGRIVEQLPQEIRAGLNKNVSADLVNIPSHQVLEHFVAAAA